VSSQPGEYYKYYLQTLKYEDRLLERNHMRRALTMSDLRTAHAQKQPIIVQSLEGAQFIEGHVERVEEAYKRGVRHFQMLHEHEDLVSPLGDVYTAAPHLGGLTPIGAEVIKECNRLGMVVDIAHGTYATVTAALKVSTQPMLISHTGAYNWTWTGTAPADVERREGTKKSARAVADAGGVVGVWWRMANSVKDYVAQIRTMTDAFGVDHVGIGTDTSLTASQGHNTNSMWPDENGAFFYAVAGEMLNQGFTPEEIGKVGGGNFCRVFAKATGGHA
jgi:membrane dipeptidase